jgi:hypothetical protein
MSVNLDLSVTYTVRERQKIGSAVKYQNETRFLKEFFLLSELFNLDYKIYRVTKSRHHNVRNTI